MRDTSYPKPLVKIDHVWYSVEGVDYVNQTLIIKNGMFTESYKFHEIEQWTTVWEG